MARLAPLALALVSCGTAVAPPLEAGPVAVAVGHPQPASSSTAATEAPASPPVEHRCTVAGHYFVTREETPICAGPSDRCFGRIDEGTRFSQRAALRIEALGWGSLEWDEIGTTPIGAVPLRAIGVYLAEAQVMDGWFVPTGPLDVTAIDDDTVEVTAAPGADVITTSPLRARWRCASLSTDPYWWLWEETVLAFGVRPEARYGLTARGPVEVRRRPGEPPIAQIMPRRDDDTFSGARAMPEAVVIEPRGRDLLALIPTERGVVVGWVDARAFGPRQPAPSLRRTRPPYVRSGRGGGRLRCDHAIDVFASLREGVALAARIAPRVPFDPEHVKNAVPFRFVSDAEVFLRSEDLADCEER